MKSPPLASYTVMTQSLLMKITTRQKENLFPPQVVNIALKAHQVRPGVVHAFDLNTWGDRQKGLCELEASLVHKTSPRQPGLHK